MIGIGKRCASVILVALLLVALLPSTAFAVDVVSDAAALKVALENASTDGKETVVYVTADIEMSSTTVPKIPAGANVRIVGAGGSLSSATVNNWIEVGTTSSVGAILTLENISFSVGKGTGITVRTNSVVNLRNVIFITDETDDVQGGGISFYSRSVGGSINVESGEYTATGGNLIFGIYKDAGTASNCVVNINPTGNVSINGTIGVNDSVAVNIDPQSGYDIDSVINGVEDITEAVKNAGGIYQLDRYNSPMYIQAKPGTPPYNSGTLTVDGNAGLGGSMRIDHKTGDFIFTATDQPDCHYVLDEITVDGTALSDNSIRGKDSYTWNASSLGSGSHTVTASFAYTLNITPPSQGTATIKRGDEVLENGDIVRYGDVLEIEYEDTNFCLNEDTLRSAGLTGITYQEDKYVVTAEEDGTTPTPAIDFSQAIESKQTLATPVISLTSGEVAYGTTFTITCADSASTSGVNIYYTTDGSTPTSSSTRYTVPVAVTRDMTVKAIAIRSGWNDSVVATANYTVPKYNITAASDNITFSVDGENVTKAVQDSLVTINVKDTIDIGYSPKVTCTPAVPVTVTGTGTNTSITFTMPASDVTVAVSIEKAAPIEGADGSGTESDPYLISNTEQLESFRDAVNNGYDFAGEYVKLSNDVKLTGATIGYEDRSFSGTFDGNEKTVTVERLNSLGTYKTNQLALFGAVKGGTIQNLTVDGSVTSIMSQVEKYPSGGGIVAYGEDITIKNCVNLAQVTSTSSSRYIGGILGRGVGNYVRIENCVNDGTVSCNGNGNYHGGIVGYLEATENTVTDCINYKNISGGGVLGGIVGGTGNSAAGKRLVLNGCVNYGSVTTGSGSDNGGIVGVSDYQTTITNCGNEGALSVWIEAGGIIAGFGSSTGTAAKLEIAQCYNSGLVYGETAIGGIVGHIDRYAAGSSITDVYNSGTIEEKGYDSGSSGVGGVIGGLSGSSTSPFALANVYNVGDIIPSGYPEYVGQLVGMTQIGSTAGDEGVTLTNGWYLLAANVDLEESDTVPKAIGSGTADPEGVTAAYEAELRSAMTVDALGEGWAADIGLNDQYPILKWQTYTTTHNITTTLTAPAGSEASMTINGHAKSSGDVVTVAERGGVTWNVTVNKEYEVTAWTINGTKVTPDCVTEGLYSTYSVSETVMEALDVKITVQKKASDTSTSDALLSSTVSTSQVWDGRTVDVSWYFGHERDTTYSISTPAQLAGVAALVNGLVNPDCTVYTGTATYSAKQWNDVSNGFVIQAGAEDTGSTGSNMSTDIYHYGIEDFNGKTIVLTDNIDMGAVYSYGSWYGPNYMPIGGQYLMETNDATTKLSSSFCGTLDGGGHYVYNIYCDRRCGTGNFGDGQSVGLIGRLGVHDSDPVSWRPVQPTVKNVGVTGYIYANRSVAGIVGKVGKTAYNNGTDNVGAVIENCVNYARVVGTDAKGTGGVVGANWNGGIVLNCYNMGNVTGGWPAGGVVGTNENLLQNCYNTGTIDSASGDVWAEAIGTRNGDWNHDVVNCYYLEGSASNYGYFIDSNNVSKEGELSEAEMKAAAFVDQLNGTDSKYPGEYAADTNGINGGYPVLKWQLTNTASKDIVSDSGVSVGTITPAEPEKPEETEEPVGSSTEVADGTATVTIDSELLTEKLDELKEDEEAVKQIVIEADIPEDETVNQVTVVLTAEDTSAIAAAGATLKTVSPLAEITLSNAALKAAVKQAEEEEEAQVTVTASVQEESGTIAIQVAVNDTVMEKVAASGILVTLPVDEEALSAGSVLVLVDADGNETVVKKSVVGEDSVSALLNGSCTLKVVDNAASFSDTEGHWGAGSIDFVSARGLFQGMEEDVFAPNLNMSRAMLATVLHRLEDTPDTAVTKAFGDVGSDAWYTDSVHWASENGIVNGFDDGSFCPNDSITREQMATMVYRYAGFLGMDVSDEGDMSRFTDTSAISDWASEAMEWAVSVGLVEGKGNGVLDPKGNATRAEVAAIMQRLIGLMMQVQ